MSGPLGRVRQCLVTHGVAGPLVVGVSGGTDSVCLLHVLGQLREELKLELHVAHLNHALHAEAGRHAQYVALLCQRWKLPATIEARDVSAYRRAHRLSLEEAARQVRYAFLEEVAHGVGARWVVTGHTADDQVETVLMHLLRGSGLLGLRGMDEAGRYPYSPGKSLFLLRPLLTITRTDTEAYCRAHRLKPREDPTNVQLTPYRNRVRHRLLPLLEGFNPQIGAGILRLAQVARGQVDLLESLVDAIWPAVVGEDPGGLRIASQDLLKEPRPVRQHLLRRGIEQVLGSLVNFEAHHLERLERALEAGAGHRLLLPHGLRATTEHGALYLYQRRALPLPPLQGEHLLKLPGETPVGGWRVLATVVAGPYRVEGREAWRAQMSYQPGTPLWVRARRPGDRFHPLGMPQPKKLQDFMVDAHIPREVRDRVPLLCSPQGILWVAGWRLGELARVEEGAGQVLLVEFTPTTPEGQELPPRSGHTCGGSAPPGPPCPQCAAAP